MQTVLFYAVVASQFISQDGVQMVVPEYNTFLLFLVLKVFLQNGMDAVIGPICHNGIRTSAGLRRPSGLSLAAP